MILHSTSSDVEVGGVTVGGEATVTIEDCASFTVFANRTMCCLYGVSNYQATYDCNYAFLPGKYSKLLIFLCRIAIPGTNGKPF